MEGHDEQCERLRERVVRLEERYEAMQTALGQARVELDRRMAELNDVRNRFLPREVYDREHSGLRDRVTELERSKAGAMGTVTAFGSVIAFLMALAALLIRWKG